MFEGQPKGLYALALANTGERFGYYTMLAVFVLFLQANFGFSTGTAGLIYSVFLGFVYFLPLFGGMLADKFGFGKMVTIGITIMFFGYLLLAIPLGTGIPAIAAMGGALALICAGTGLFKGNLQVMVGNLYDEARFSSKRDSGFQIFYMAINIGAMFAPTAAIKMMEWACLVFAVVIFFWMAFHQNGSTLTYFARDYTATTSTGVASMAFDVINLVFGILVVYGLFGLFQSTTGKGKIISLAVILAAVGGLIYKYNGLPDVTNVSAPIFQHFNACFVVALTPVSIALFGMLAKKGKEPSAPLKIGLGMLVAAVAYILMTVGSIGLPVPTFDAAGQPQHMADVTPNLLITTYLILTFAELLLSPIGISFVSKVAPPKYAGMMMGGWFVSTAIGNLLVSIPALMWGAPLTIVWGVLVAICLVAALFIFVILKRLEKVAK